MNYSATSMRTQRHAQWLVAGTALWDAIEAAAALIVGVATSSVALTAFGLDSLIEIAAAGALLWRLRLEFRNEPEDVIARGEQRTLRFVGWTFMALTVYVIVRSGFVLWQARAPDASLLGVLIAAAALVVMPLLAWGKLRAADRIGSRALRAEAKESLACMYLSLAVLMGLGAHALFGWWWADPLAALAMVPWLVSEGREALEGEAG